MPKAPQGRMIASHNHAAVGQDCAICNVKMNPGDAVDQITFDDDPPLPATGKPPRYWTHADCSAPGTGELT